MDQDKKDILLYALQREDNLINNRLMWLLTFQGFLFAVAAISFTSNGSPKYFIHTIALLGAVTALTCVEKPLGVKPILLTQQKQIEKTVEKRGRL